MDVCDGRHIVFVTNNRLGSLSGVAKPRALDGCGILGLEKRETLRQTQGRLWGTPGEVGECGSAMNAYTRV
jgi:hypothetical protein